ncbi:hypothetical protein FOCC_FOCC006186 [Frankliniella occidentalis]|nr:hypothetical protein FOCC_FOCC006186 [Frankliniella occidentalis]
MRTFVVGIDSEKPKQALKQVEFLEWGHGPDDNQLNNAPIFVEIDDCPDKERNSRDQRRKRALGKHVEGQSRITSYFPVLNQIEVTLKCNKDMIDALSARREELALSKPAGGKFSLSSLLRNLMETALKNSEKRNHGQRYDDDIKLYSVYLCIVGGGGLYEFLWANLPNSMPSLSTVERELKTSARPVMEGVFRFEELKNFLEANDLPLKVSISEVGTRIQERFSFDPFTNKDWSEWFFASAQENYVVMQDAIHSVNKFRTRLTPPHTHIRSVIKNIEQGFHGLTKHDLDKEDKMNFNASKKICSERVTDQLSLHVAGSKATILYLTSMRYLMEGCLDTSLSPSEKLCKVWYCVLFLRYWKKWLLDHSTYKVSEQFITPNLYVCVEVIAHALIKLLVKFRDSPIYLFIHLYSSQPCEMFFRLARSMTTESTVINFSIKEFLARVKRIDLLHFCTCKLGEKLEFPKEKRKKLLGIMTQEKLEASYLPSDHEIKEIVMAAKTDVISKLRKCGLKITESASVVRIKSYPLSTTDFQDGGVCGTSDE